MPCHGCKYLKHWWTWISFPEIKYVCVGFFFHRRYSHWKLCNIFPRDTFFVVFLFFFSYLEMWMLEYFMEIDQHLIHDVFLNVWGHCLSVFISFSKKKKIANQRGKTDTLSLKQEKTNNKARNSINITLIYHLSMANYSISRKKLYIAG